MQWYGYKAKHYKINKKWVKVIDKKAECDSLFSNDEEYKILKSVVIGNTYYAAARTQENEVIAIIVLINTSLHNNENNFKYKFMTEFVQPYEAKCPISILNLLTTTSDKYAIRWRKKCWMYQNKPSLIKAYICKKEALFNTLKTVFN